MGTVVADLLPLDRELKGRIEEAEENVAYLLQTYSR